MWNVGTFLSAFFDLAFNDTLWFILPLITRFLWQISCFILLYHFFKRASKADIDREKWTLRIKLVIMIGVFVNIFVISMILA